jgi:hypothetical protein
MENIQRLFQDQLPYFQPWCRWDFESGTLLKETEELRSTLLVWDELWKGVFTIIKEDEELHKEKPWEQTYDASLASLIHTRLREIFQYALEHDGIQVITRMEID